MISEPTIRSSRSLLLIEDNASNADMLAKRLDRAGYEVEIARNAAEALNALVSQRPALILLDIRLPDMSGIELAGHIRRIPHHRETPMIAVTADAIPGVLEQALQAGCCGYVIKPIDFRDLLAKIEKCL